MSDIATLHPMADPVVRRRTTVVLAAIVALTWSAVSLLGRSTGPYAPSELPDLAGLPVLVPQIEQLVPPETGDVPAIRPPRIVPTQGGESP